jgi:hypothetical protein
MYKFLGQKNRTNTMLSRKGGNIIIDKKKIPMSNDQWCNFASSMTGTGIANNLSVYL